MISSSEFAGGVIWAPAIPGRHDAVTIAVASEALRTQFMVSPYFYPTSLTPLGFLGDRVSKARSALRVEAVDDADHVMVVDLPKAAVSAPRADVQDILAVDE